VFVDIQGVDVGTYVEEARAAVASQVTIPTGYSITWSGQYEYLQRAQERLRYVVPFTLLLIVFVIFINTGSTVETLIVLLGVPFAVTGAVWLLDMLDYNLSVAVWVGVIALAGLYAETGMILLLYLDRAYDEYRDRGLLTDRGALVRAIHDGSVKRVRPILMTISTDILGLLPIMWSQGAGADVMKRIAAPLVGGVATSGVTVLLLFPVAYYLWKSRGLPREASR
jgi:Cu(I)/Ag(I) efflux system membrane protein CusA/SilA